MKNSKVVQKSKVVRQVETILGTAEKVSLSMALIGPSGVPVSVRGRLSAHQVLAIGDACEVAGIEYFVTGRVIESRLVDLDLEQVEMLIHMEKTKAKADTMRPGRATLAPRKY